MRKAMKFLDDHLEEIFISLMMGYFVLVTVLQIIFRFVLRVPASWTEETAKYAFIWMTFVGSSLGAKIQSHIRVDMLETSLGGTLRIALNLLSQIIFLLFGVITTIVGINMCIALLSRPQLSPALKIPMQYIYASLPIGMGLMSLRVIRNLCAQIRELSAGTIGGKEGA
jgi:TRAP-type C4-dicarboxylate transport system permease small subunit